LHWCIFFLIQLFDGITWVRWSQNSSLSPPISCKLIFVMVLCKHYYFHLRLSTDIINLFFWPRRRAMWLFREWKLNNLTPFIHDSLGVSSIYASFIFSFCRLFIFHNCLMVLSHSLFHWHGCVIRYSWFSKPKYSLFILFNPVIRYSLFSFYPQPLDLMFSLIKFTLTDTRIENVNESVPTSNLLAVTHSSINYHYPLCNSKYKKNRPTLTKFRLLAFSEQRCWTPMLLGMKKPIRFK